MRVAAAVLGVVLFGGLIVLAIAGVTAATAVIITAAAVVVMIGLGNAVGGRHTPNRSPYPVAPDPTPATGPTGAAEDGDADDGVAEDGAAADATDDADAER
jgi:hypothetical protein